MTTTKAKQYAEEILSHLSGKTVEFKLEDLKIVLEAAFHSGQSETARNILNPEKNREVGE